MMMTVSFPFFQDLETTEAVTVIENTSPEASFTLSLVGFSTESGRVIKDSSLPISVPSFSSSATRPLLASMSIQSLDLPGVDLPEVGSGVSFVTGKVRVIAGPLIAIALLDSDLENTEMNFTEPMIFRASEHPIDSASCGFLTETGEWSEEGLRLATSEEVTKAFGEIETWKKKWRCDCSNVHWCVISTL